MNNSGSVTVGHGEVDLGWCRINGMKTVSLINESNWIIWQYDLNCCAIQVTRYPEQVEWSAFSKANGDLRHRGRELKLVADTSHAEIKLAAVEAVFGASFVAEHVLDVMRQCDEEHARHAAKIGWPDSLCVDSGMSLNGWLEPFKMK